MLLGTIEKKASGGADDSERYAERDEAASVRSARRRQVGRATAARDHAAFSAMIYAGLRIEETTALTVDDLSFVRGADEVRIAKGKGNKERLVHLHSK